MYRNYVFGIEVFFDREGDFFLDLGEFFLYLGVIFSLEIFLFFVQIAIKIAVKIS